MITGESIPLTICVRRPVYDWLIRTSGWTNDEIGEELFKEGSDLEKFKTNLKSPKSDISITFEDGVKLCDVLKRPLTALLLSKPPKEFPLPKDHRVFR